MASPNCKRLKMNQEASFWTVKEETLESKDQMDFHSSTSNFGEVAKKSCFVDKTLLIKAIFNNPHKMILITAPRRFGKSTNMDMVKKFVEIQVDATGTIVDKEASSNYKIFKNKNPLIFQDQDFFNQHFATYPVIHTNFKGVSGNTFDEVLKGFRTVLSHTYLQYRYLMKSQIWSCGDLDIDTFKKYIDSEKSKALDVAEIEAGLEFLSKCLYRHFDNKRVFVLIDEYDGPINNTMFKENINIKRVNEILSMIFSNALKENRCVERALLTGSSHFATVGLYGANNIKKYRFLNDHRFVPYYGLTENEVTDLLTRFKIDDDTKEKVKLHYNGYVSLNGVKLFFIWSILNFLEEKKIKNFWEASGVVTNLEEAMHIPVVRHCIEKFCLGKSVVAADILYKVEIDDIIKLRKVCSQKAGSETDQLVRPDLYLSFILQQGYLTFEKQGCDQLYAVRAPNAEIVSEFRNKLWDHYDESINLYVEKCAVTFNKISSSSEDEIFKDFISELNTALHKLNDKFVVNSEDTYHCLLFYILCKTKFSGGTEFTFPGARLDLILCTDNLGIIMEVKYKKSSMKALEQIMKLYLNVFDQKPYFENVTEKIYIGINVSENNIADMSVLVNSTDISKARCF